MALPNPVIFQTDRFDLTWPADPDSAPPWGRDCAMFFAERFPRYGVRTVDPEPDHQEGGWCVQVEAPSGVQLMVFVSWCPVGPKPSTDFWSVQVWPWPSLVPMFLRRKPSDQDYAIVQQAVASIIDGELRAANVRWLSWEQFEKL
jgi:hypothetical protein